MARKTADYVVGKSAKDFKEILDLEKFCFPHDARFLPENPDGWDGVHAWKLKGGFIIVERTHAGWAYVSRVGVLPTYRGKGLSKSLIQEAQVWARTCGYNLYTYVMPHNAPSLNAFFHAGFTAYEPKEPYVDDEVVYLMY